MTAVAGPSTSAPIGDPAKPWTQRQIRRMRLVDATLIDPKDGNVYQHVTIDLKDGLVHKLQLGKTEEALKWTTNEQIQVINLGGRYVCPGLIDCHIHIATPPGENGLQDTLNQHHDTHILRQPYLAHEILKRGFTTVRDCGGANLAFKEALDEGLHPGPRMFIAGQAISQTGGHGDLRTSKDQEYDCCGGNSRGLGRVADGVEQCLHAAREELRRGADFIKIMVSGGVASPTDKLTGLQYTPAEIQAFTAVAENVGTYVTAHAYTPASIQIAISNGVRGIEHGNLLDEPTAKLMAERGTFLTPTLATYEFMASKEFSNFLPPANRFKNLEVLDAGKRAVQIADKAGVTMCYGTDLLGPGQAKQTSEFKLRKQAGLSALKILQSATVNAARMLMQEDKLGRLKEGFAADLVVLNANPLEDIEVLDRPEKHLLAVIKGGRVMASRSSKIALDVDSLPQIE